MGSHLDFIASLAENSARADRDDRRQRRSIWENERGKDSPCRTAIVFVHNVHRCASSQNARIKDLEVKCGRAIGIHTVGCGEGLVRHLSANAAGLAAGQGAICPAGV